MWSGIWGSVALVRRSSLALTQFTVRTLSLGDEQSAAPAVLELTAWLGNGHADHAVLLELGALTLESTITEHGGDGRVVAQQALPLRDAARKERATSGSMETRTHLRLSVAVPSPKLWSPRSPNLYHAHWTIRSDGNADGARVGRSHAHARFGIRQLNISGQYFLLNGKRHFLVGTGDDFGYPTEAPPQNLSVYRARLGAMKAYGFDFVRLHSHFESKMYFDVAAELGFFISPALPGTAWSADCKEIALRTWKWWINELRNCPSVMDVNMKNEGYGEPPKLAPGELGGWPGAPFVYRDEFYAVAKQMRPELHVIATDGCCWSSGQRNKAAVQETVDGPDICPEPYANGSCATPTNDFMTPSFGIQTPLIFREMYADTQCGTGNECGPPPKPIIIQP